VPKHHIEGDVNLGTWVQHQRTDYPKRTIDLTRTALLDAVPGWTWNTKEVRWQQGFKCLQRFVTNNGHARVPNAHYEDGFPLGRWVLRQRQLHGCGELNGCLGTWVPNQRKAQEKGQFSPGRAERLGRLPGWSWDAFDAGWEEKFAALAKYVERTGNTAMPRDWVEDGYWLGRWIGAQRQSYRRGALSEERRRRLETLRGWSWNTLEEKWEEGFRHLEDFITREGSAAVAVPYVEDDGFRLGQWTAVQRYQHAHGKLSVERVRRLESQPGWAWDMVAARQQDAMTCLRAFVAREGHARVPVAHVEGAFPLGSWAMDRRRAYRSGKLDDQVAQELGSLPGRRW